MATSYTASGAPPNWDLVPEHLRETLRRYIERGQHPGDFVGCLLSNDLQGTVSRADKKTFDALPDIVSFLHTYLPNECWGSREAVAAWMRKGGLQAG
jgi:hypothetical protein